MPIWAPSKWPATEPRVGIMCAPQNHKAFNNQRRLYQTPKMILKEPIGAQAKPTWAPEKWPKTRPRVGMAWTLGTPKSQSFNFHRLFCSKKN